MVRNAYARLMDAAKVPQTEPLNARQVPNSAGGFAFAADAFARLDRFLVLGSDGGTYYQSPRTLTRENAASVLACYRDDPGRTVARIVEVSEAGRAPRVSPAIFALALGAASSDVAARKAALVALPRVCRTASHLFEFVACVRALGKGWGRALKDAVAEWYLDRDADKLAYQAVKYRSRNGYSHKRLLQLSHPAAKVDDLARRSLFAWMAGAREFDRSAFPAVASAHLEAMATGTARDLLPLVLEHRLPWEAVPTWALADGEVWKALLPSMGMTALIRNLGTLTRLGVLRPLSAELSLVTGRLGDAEALRRERVHPYAMLLAHSVYGRGRGLKGSTSWTPMREILDALDRGFYAAFGSVEATGKRHLLALDVSGSMGSAILSGSPLSAREASAAMALVTMTTERSTHVVGFSHSLVPLDVSPRMRLGEVVRKVGGIPFGSTDCAQPMLYAMERGIEVDAFVVYTDSETWSGKIHPSEALRRYRKKTGIDARMVVVGMTSNGFSIADPADAGMLDVVGFDTSAPSVIADFVRR